uniref:Hyaluronan and proteoglycan link protein 3 n=1 Tax=Sphaeramia orbicularis TaxID=375764 RepID=A0A672Z4X3_9TELE
MKIFTFTKRKIWSCRYLYVMIVFYCLSCVLSPGPSVELHVDSAQTMVFASSGGNATLPCRFWFEPELSLAREVRIKWSRTSAAGGPEDDVLVAIGNRSRSFGNFRGRVHLRQDSAGDAALIMTELQLNDTGRYRCEVVDGLEDRNSAVHLELRGTGRLTNMYVVFVL